MLTLSYECFRCGAEIRVRAPLGESRVIECPKCRERLRFRVTEGEPKPEGMPEQVFRDVLQPD